MRLAPQRTALQKKMRALCLAASSSEARRPRRVASGDAVWAGRAPHPRGSVTEAVRSQPAERDDGRRDGDVASRTVRLADDVADVLDNDDHAWRTGPRGVCQRPDLWCAIKRPGRTPRKKICPGAAEKKRVTGESPCLGKNTRCPGNKMTEGRGTPPCPAHVGTLLRSFSLLLLFRRSPKSVGPEATKQRDSSRCGRAETPKGSV